MPWSGHKIPNKHWFFPYVMGFSSKPVNKNQSLKVEVYSFEQTSQMFLLSESKTGWETQQYCVKLKVSLIKMSEMLET